MWILLALLKCNFNFLKPTNSRVQGTKILRVLRTQSDYDRNFFWLLGLSVAPFPPTVVGPRPITELRPFFELHKKLTESPKVFVNLTKDILRAGEGRKQKKFKVFGSEIN